MPTYASLARYYSQKISVIVVNVDVALFIVHQVNWIHLAMASVALQYILLVGCFMLGLTSCRLEIWLHYLRTSIVDQQLSSLHIFRSAVRLHLLQYLLLNWFVPGIC